MGNLVKIIRLSLVVAGSLSVISSAIVAQELPNKNEKLTEIELLKGQNKQMQNNQGNKGMGKQANMPTFENFDLNNDGMISAKEMEESREKRMEEKASEGKMMKNIGNQPLFSDIDTNNDGNISKEEFQSHQTNHRQ